jgi:hypothetical protein
LGDDSAQAGSIILIVLENGEGNLRFLIPPDLSKLVTGKDFLYLDSLLKDFVERAKLDSRALFKQLSSLGVGPLVTQEVGSNISDHPALLKLCSGFVQL